MQVVMTESMYSAWRELQEAMILLRGLVKDKQEYDKLKLYAHTCAVELCIALEPIKRD